MRSRFYNPLFIGSRLLTYGQSVLGLRRSDIILASFPKTGNTWVRFVVYNLLADSRDDADRPTFDQLDSSLFAFGGNNMLRSGPFPHHDRLIKTHLPYSRVFRKNRAVMVIRDPRDTMVSYFHFASANKNRHFEGDFGAFIRDERFGIQPYFRHYASWKERAGLILRYEDMKADPHGAFARMTGFCGYPTDPERLERAIRFSSMKNVRKAQEASQERFSKTFTGDYKFARAGSVKQWPEYFSEADTAWYEEQKTALGFDAYAD